MSRRSHLIAALSIFAALFVTGLVYWPGLDGPFLLDDYSNFVNINVANLDPARIYYEITHNNSGFFGRPVSMLSLLVTGMLHGQEPWGYKFHNLAIHLITGLLILWLLIKLMPRLVPQMPAEKGLLVAGLTSALWLLHPLLVSTVLYSVQRMAQLSALFTLAALVTYVSARELANKGGVRFYTLVYGIFPLFLFLAILSKENGGLIIFYVLAIELIAFRFLFQTSGCRNRVAWFLAIFVAIPLAVVSIYVLTHFAQLSNYSLRNFDMGDRLLTQLHVVAMYLKMILLPRLADMTLYHDYIQVTSSFDPVTILLLFVLLAAVFSVFYLRVRAPVLSFAIAWFLISHLMESTIFDLEMMFEHRNYLAAIGPLFAVVYYLFRVSAFAQLKYLTGVILLLLIFMTFSRVQEWRSLNLINQVAVIEHPDSVRAQTEFVNYRFSLGDIEGALDHIHIVQDLKKTDFGPFVHEVFIRCGSGADLQSQLQEAKSRAANFPITPYSLFSLDNLLRAMNENHCPEVESQEVLDLVTAAINQQDNQASDRELGFLEKIKGNLYFLMEKYPEGAGMYLSAYEHTGMVRILAELSEILIQFDRFTEAQQIIDYMEDINEGSFGAETAILEPVKENLARAREDMLSASGDEGR